MSQELILGVIGAAALVLAAILGAPRIGRDARSSITKDLEIYGALPESSPARGELLSSIERRVQQLSGLDTASRSPISIGVGIALLVVSIVGAWLVAISGGWWWLASPAVIFVFALGLTGVATGATNAPRDDKGNIAK